jgi:hypothetical protein
VEGASILEPLPILVHALRTKVVERAVKAIAMDFMNIRGPSSSIFHDPKQKEQSQKTEKAPKP